MRIVEVMWKNGIFNGYNFWIKYYDVPSIYGINKGRISKLMIKKDSFIYYNFDRGEDINKMDHGAKRVYNYLIAEFN